MTSRWSRYHAGSQDREPRPLLLEACAAAGPGAGRRAVDLGCGSGTDVLALLERGWTVLGTDADADAIELARARVPARSAGRVTFMHAPFAGTGIPPAHLIHAGYALPFCVPDEFGGVWARVRGALKPGGVLAVNLLGPRDSWAGESRPMTFCSLDQARELLDDLDILHLEQTVRDGTSGSGPKTWHLVDILVRRPV